MRRLLVVTLIAAGFLAAAPLASAEEPAPSITVVGSGSVSGVPDTAEVTVGVVTQAATASQAMSQNSATMGKVLKALTALGIADRDIHTTNVSIVPQRASTQPSRPAPSSPMPSSVVGYEVTNQVRVRVRNLSSLGRLLDTLVSQGANALGGIGFSIADPAPLLEQARSKAIADARQKAQVYATAAGVKVGRVIFIRDEPAGPPRPMAGRMMAMAATPIAPGEHEVEVSVSVTYALE
jgi:uncharacterized protein YggE